MGRWSNLNRRDFLGRALGAAASFYVLPPGAGLASELLQPQIKFAPFQFPEEFKTAKANLSGTASPTPSAE